MTTRSAFRRSKRPKNPNHKFERSLLQKVPARFCKYVTADTLDLSDATKFYKQQAAAVEVLKDYVEVAGPSQYRLKNGFNHWFLESLRTFDNHPAEPPNALADVFYLLSVHWAQIQYGHLPSDPSEGKVPDRVLREEWIKSWERLGARDWETFRSMGRPSPWGASGAFAR